MKWFKKGEKVSFLTTSFMETQNHRKLRGLSFMVFFRYNYKLYAFQYQNMACYLIRCRQIPFKEIFGAAASSVIFIFFCLVSLVFIL